MPTIPEAVPPALRRPGPAGNREPMPDEAHRGSESAAAARDPGYRAPWAVRPGASRGRLHPEPGDARSPFGRDRDRIIHSSAFRQLQYKT